MPRSNRGGARNGAPGTAYSNRTDLNMPKATVPGQEYGKQAEQMRAQSAVPMGQSPVAAPPMAPAAPQAQAARPSITPGSLPFLDQTQRPYEPIQAGLPSGPGAGPEAIAAPPRGILSSSLLHMANSATANSATYDLLHTAQSLGL